MTVAYHVQRTDVAPPLTTLEKFMKIKYAAPASLLTLFLGALAVAQQEPAPSFDEIDSDANGQVTLIEAEQSAEVVRLFGELDTNADGQLSNEEYAQIHVVLENH